MGQRNEKSGKLEPLSHQRSSLSPNPTGSWAIVYPDRGTFNSAARSAMLENPSTGQQNSATFMKRTLLLSIALLFLTTNASYSETGPHKQTAAATIVYSGNLDGELEPCGCSEGGDLGGILRRASKIAELRKQRPELFLISSGGLLANASPRDRLKSEYILKGIAAMDYDAIGLQWRDLSYGVDFLKQTPLPWSAGNWGEKGTFAGQRRIRHGDVELAFFTWLDPEGSPFRRMKGEHTAVISDPGQLRKALREADRQGALTVLSTTLEPAQAEQLFPPGAGDIDILIIKSAYEEYGEPRQTGSTLLLQPGSRGMRLGYLHLELDGKGDIASWRHEVIPLPKSVPDAPPLAAWYEEYNAKVKAAYLASVEQRKLQQSGQSPYTGAEACQSCHEKPWQVWSESLHARAFQRLEEVGKSFDPDCIVCHTVGFEKPGGYIDTRLTMHLLDVQCESCHGPGREHVESQGKKPTPNKEWGRDRICAQCHTQPHSPEFNPDGYWARIAH